MFIVHKYLDRAILVGGDKVKFNFYQNRDQPAWAFNNIWGNNYSIFLNSHTQIEASGKFPRSFKSLGPRGVCNHIPQTNLLSWHSQNLLARSPY